MYCLPTYFLNEMEEIRKRIVPVLCPQLSKPEESTVFSHPFVHSQGTECRVKNSKGTNICTREEKTLGHDYVLGERIQGNI